MSDPTISQPPKDAQGIQPPAETEVPAQVSTPAAGDAAVPTPVAGDTAVPAPAAGDAAVATPVQPVKKKPSLFKRVWDGVVLYVRKLTEGLLPNPYYVEGENVLQVIKMASYRAVIPKVLGILSILLLLFTIVMFTMAQIFRVRAEGVPALAQQASDYELWAILGLLGAAYAIFKTVQTWLAYNQWQFIITDKRIIITTPDPDHALFADSIYLDDKTIKVLDTNFSTSPLWLAFQVGSGARDVMLSMGGYEFMEKGAKVKGGIRFPDVSLEDTRKLEALVFGNEK